MNIDEFEILFKEQKYYYFKLDKKEKSIICNSSGGSSQPLRELVEIVNLLTEKNIKHILKDDKHIIMEF
jgi:hypothetical protein